MERERKDWNERLIVGEREWLSVLLKGEKRDDGDQGKEEEVREGE